MRLSGSSFDELATADFRKLIAQIVKEELAKLLGFQHPPENRLQDRAADVVPIQQNKQEFSPQKVTNNWLTHSEAAVYLKTTSAVLYKLSSLRKIKFSKRGKRNYYKKEHLEQYLTDGEIQTQDEIAEQTKLKGKMKII